MSRHRHAHKRGSKGSAGGYGGYRRRYVWPDDRVRPLESEASREARARAIQAYLDRGGRIKRISIAVAKGALHAQPGESFIERACREAELLEELRAVG